VAVRGRPEMSVIVRVCHETRTVVAMRRGSSCYTSGMTELQAVVMGIVQGLTEFLPISSTGHLRIVPAFLGWDDPGAAFTAVIQLGTMAAVLVYFRRDLWNISRGLVKGLFDSSARATQEFRHGVYICLGTIPICIFGLLFSHQIETGARNLYLIGSTLIVLGILLGIADRMGKRSRPVESITARDAVAIGFAQALALIPGVSRSGSTITAGLFLGLDRAAAARFSFLLSVPAVVLSGLFEARKIGDGNDVGLTATLIAVVFAFIAGWISIAGLLRFLTRHSMSVFVIYRIVLGAIVISLASTGTIS
jgi:undecaprenyl-diphosphatase